MTGLVRDTLPALNVQAAERQVRIELEVAHQPLWLSGDFGMTDKQAGWWAATFSTLVTLFVFLVGSIADATGVRKTLILSFGLAALTRLGMSLAPTPQLAIVTLPLFGFAGKPENAEIKLGNFYLDIFSLSGSVLWSDNINLTEVGRKSDEIAVVRL